MSLMMLSGIDEDMLSGRAERRSKRAAKKQARQEKREERKESGKGLFKKVATVGLAPSRIAFIGAVRINALKLASRLAKLYKKNPKKFEDFWIKFGGKPSELKEVVEKGSKESLGVIDPATQSAIAAALPIITVLLKTLKGEGVSSEGVSEEEEKTAIDTMKDELNNNPEIGKDVTQMPEETEVAKVKAPVSTDTTAETGTGNKNMLLYAGIGVAAIFILPKILKK